MSIDKRIVYNNLTTRATLRSTSKGTELTNNLSYIRYLSIYLYMAHIIYVRVQRFVLVCNDDYVRITKFYRLDTNLELRRRF